MKGRKSMKFEVISFMLFLFFMVKSAVARIWTAGF